MRLMQVVHFDTAIERDAFSWVRGTNRFLPDDIAVQWAQPVPDEFHCRASALGRRYALRAARSRRCAPAWMPAASAGLCARSTATRCAPPLRILVGEHDFSSFRASACQARSPVKTHAAASRSCARRRRRCHWHFEFEANAFLHHMIRNIMGCLVRVGQGDAAAGVDARGAGRRAAAMRPRRPSRPTACTSWGRVYDAALGASAERRRTRCV